MSAPKVTLDQLNDAIKDVKYVVMPDGRTTICQLTLDNNFSVRGESSCASIENFNQTIDEQIAYQNAQASVDAGVAAALADLT